MCISEGKVKYKGMRGIRRNKGGRSGRLNVGMEEIKVEWRCEWRYGEKAGGRSGEMEGGKWNGKVDGGMERKLKGMDGRKLGDSTEGRKGWRCEDIKGRMEGIKGGCRGG